MMKRNVDNIKSIIISRAVVVRDNHLLVCESPDKSYYYLPGGHVEFCEPVKDALLREIEEETKESGVIKQYLGYIECNFIYNNKEVFELGHYFTADIPTLKFPAIPEAYEEGLTFMWLHANEVKSSNLKPEILKTKVPELLNGKNSIWNFNSIDR